MLLHIIRYVIISAIIININVKPSQYPQSGGTDFRTHNFIK